MIEAGESCRIDVWLFRARFFKTRGLAARVVESGGARLQRGAARLALDKPSRLVRVGDVLTFPQGARFISLRIEGLGERRGPAAEARLMFSLLEFAGAQTGICR